MDLGERMKAYEEVFRQRLPIRMPVVVRLDGKAFHTLTRGCMKPFDQGLRDALIKATLAVLEEMPARMAYHQSDEISFLLIDYNRFDTMQWFDGIVQKIASVSASVMGAHFSLEWHKPGYFDARVFAVPERDIVNYFIWRQRDCQRNAISAVAQSLYSPKELHGKNSEELKVMIGEKGPPFDSYDPIWRHGSIVMRGLAAFAAPNFSDDREYLKDFLHVEQE